MTTDETEVFISLFIMLMGALTVCGILFYLIGLWLTIAFWVVVIVWVCFKEYAQTKNS